LPTLLLGLKIFGELAKSKNFDPLDIEKWYTIKKSDIKEIVSCYFMSLNVINIFAFRKVE
jgi:hypothetical protein